MRRIPPEVRPSCKIRNRFEEIAQVAGKRIAFYVLLMCIVILSVEAASQLLFFARDGYFLFQRGPHEIYNVRDFSVVTTDARGFTAIPNYTNPRYYGWSVSFDAFGFRRGTQTARSSGQPTIVFIGDSVPFGWGVSDKGSLPSLFFERLQEHHMPFGVVNAALPSYALAQAVARYECEIHGRMAVDTMYLKIYDPASQLAVRGSRWQPSDNWMNEPYVNKSFLSRHSATAVLGEKVGSRFNLNVGGANSFVETFDPHDTATTRRVYVHVRTELERLLALGQMDGARHLVVAPITLPAQSLNGHHSPRRLAAIELVNQGIEDFARAHHTEVIFADTISLLSRYPDADVFLDRCCHLSERGNALVADYLMTLLLNSGHSSRTRVDRENRARRSLPTASSGESFPQIAAGKSIFSIEAEPLDQRSSPHLDKCFREHPPTSSSAKKFLTAAAAAYSKKVPPGERVTQYVI